MQLPSSNTETNSARTLPPCEGNAVGDIGQVAASLQQLGGSSARELPPLPQRGGGGGDESVTRGTSGDNSATHQDLPDSQDLPANTDRQCDESACSQDSFHHKVHDAREPVRQVSREPDCQISHEPIHQDLRNHFHRDRGNYPFYDSHGPPDPHGPFLPDPH